MRKFLICLLLLILFSQIVIAHSTFFPHHSDDFSPEEIAERNELRSTVLIATAIFVVIVGSGIYFAIRQIPEEDQKSERKNNVKN